MDVSRVVEIEWEYGYGSGYLIAPGVVLTARHVLEAEGKPLCADGFMCRVRAVGEGRSKRPEWDDATLIPIGNGELDIALLQTGTHDCTHKPPRFGKVPRNLAEIKCRTIGFPMATEEISAGDVRDRECDPEGRENDTYQLDGTIRTGTFLLSGDLSVDVDSQPPEDPKSWPGISGAALFAGQLLVGVIKSYPREFGGRMLKATPLAILENDPAFCEALGQPCPLPFPSELIYRNTINEVLKIEDIKEEFVFYENPLSIESLEGNFNEKWIEYPDNMQNIFPEQIKKEKKEAADRGATFDNNLSYSLRRIDVKRDQLSDGKRKNRYILQLYPTDFEHFVFPNLRLEETIYDPSTNGEILVRELCELNREKIYLSNLDNISYHFTVGTGTILITKDDYVITTIRSKRQFIAPGRSSEFIVAHLSAAEGMLGKVDLYNNQPNPFATSVRSLHDELGLKPEVDFSINYLRCLGIFLDTLRAQPFFMFYLKSNHLTALEVLKKWYNAKDKHETEFVLGVRWNVSNIIKLFYNIPIRDIEYTIDNREIESFNDFSNAFSKKLKLASNHAQIGYLSSLINDFGEEKLRELIVEYNAALVHK